MVSPMVRSNFTELAGPLPLMQRPDQDAGFEVDRREEVGGA